jgi:aspartyl-tRNA(Asn)/glutamyl-tRNA(Gln) amidotransferase subunit A
VSDAALFSIADAGKQLRDGRLTAVALAEQALARIGRHDASLNAFIRVEAETALAAAAAADAQLAAGVDLGPMHGIPYAAKDIIDVAGLPTTCHSHLMLDNIAPRDAHVIERLRAGGAILLGKLATHEFALGGPSFELPFPPARNPWNLDYAAGGSSSGSAAAVAAGFVRASIGSDSGGSIRGPAANCGVLGLKPTFGRISRRGVFPLSESLDHVGLLAASAGDAAAILQVMAGRDASDPSSADWPVPDFAQQLGVGIEELKLGYARRCFATDPLMPPQVLGLIDAAVERLAGAGARIEEIDLPAYEHLNASGKVIVLGEMFALHGQRLREHGDHVSNYLYRWAGAGVVLTAEDLALAQRARRLLAQQMADVMRGVDGIITASVFDTASLIDRNRPDSERWAGHQLMTFNVSGQPALSLPIGFSNGLPIGMQIATAAFAESMLLRIAAAYEAVAPFPASPLALAASG